MKERPILFSAPRVRALLAGTKTQTRRIVKPQPQHPQFGSMLACDDEGIELYLHGGPLLPRAIRCPFGPAGDRLWVRETHAIVPRTAYRCSEGVHQTLRPDDDHDAAIYRAGWERSTGGIRWRSSIHMPRWASRILLEVTEVRVERLQDISEADAIAEGIERLTNDFGGVRWRHYGSKALNLEGWSAAWEFARNSYASLWDSINGPGSWDANPFVWAITFRRIDAS
jgi:hypothetical protein